MDVLEEMAEEPFVVTTADMLEIVAGGGNGVEYVDIVGLMEDAAKELREKDVKIESLRFAWDTTSAECNKLDIEIWRLREALFDMSGYISRADMHYLKPETLIALKEKGGVR